LLTSLGESLTEEIKLFVAAKAFIENYGKVLLIRESSKYADGSQVGKFDVPGGRIHSGERFDESLQREVFEETGLKIKIGKPVSVNESRPVVKGENWQVVRMYFAATSETTEVVLSEDHDEYIWIDPREYKNYPIIENLYPDFDAYLEDLSKA
jgi:8-oxo-dGTP diphosphatase